MFLVCPSIHVTCLSVCLCMNMYVSVCTSVCAYLHTYGSVPLSVHPGFYTKLNVWGSLGFNLDYDGGSHLFIFILKRRILEGSTSFREGIQTGPSCQTGVAKHQVICMDLKIDRNFRSFSGLVFEMIQTKLTPKSR